MPGRRSRITPEQARWLYTFGHTLEKGVFTQNFEQIVHLCVQISHDYRRQLRRQLNQSSHISLGILPSVGILLQQSIDPSYAVQGISRYKGFNRPTKYFNQSIQGLMSSIGNA